MLRIALVAAEPSGDQLGAALMQALRKQHNEVEFVGIGGAAMQAEGLQGLFPMEQLSIMGLIEVLPHLFKLLRLRKALARQLIARRPDVFIGIDAPDFNLGLAGMLKRQGIATVQYVAPTVWAWKEGRVKTLRKSLDHVLCLFPFELQFLQQHGVNASYVGHPLADKLSLEPDRNSARDHLGLAAEDRVLALLPGSRLGEVERLTQTFLEAAQLLQNRIGPVRILVPLVNQLTKARFVALSTTYQDKLALQLLDGQAETAMTAADVVLLASGTATLQGLLCHRPMVVGYKVNALTYWLTRVLRLLKIPYVAMANLLAGEELAPEFLQYRCQPELLAHALQAFFIDPMRVQTIAKRYQDLHLALRCNAAASAASAVLALINQRSARKHQSSEQHA